MKNVIKLTESFKSDVITIITSVYEACKNLTSASIKLYLQIDSLQCFID